MREDWVECKFDEVFFTTSGGTPSRRNDDYYSGDIPWIKSGELKSNVITKAEEYISEDAVKNSSAKIFPKGTILLALYGATIGKIAILGIPAATNQAICGIYETSFVVSKYAYYFLVNKKSHLIQQGIGGAQPNISQTILKNLDFFLPPLPEQRTIVKKLDSLLSSLDAGVADLKKAQQQLKIYRHAVLKKAFEGELTKEWRSKQSNLPSNAEILKLVNDERESFYQLQLNEWENEIAKWKKEGTIDKKPTRPSKFSKPDLPTSEQESYKWLIPNGWIWKQIGEICFVTKLAGFEYTEYVKYNDNGDLPVLKAENVGSDGFKPTIYSKVDSESVSTLKRSYLNGGELLIVFVGAGTGKVGLVPYNQKFFLGPNIGMARPYFKLNGRYLEYFYRCLLGKKLLMATVKAVAQPSLSMGSIRQSPFVMCSLQEQNEIVKEIEARLSVCDSIEQNIKESLIKADALRQSILKKAFEGKLLTADELAECKQAGDYDPARVLLERIKANRSGVASKLSKKKIAPLESV